MTDDFIPVELERDATEFYRRVSTDVEGYDILKKFDSMKLNEDAEKFAAWWHMERYAEDRHSLILLYENFDTPTEEFGPYDEMNIGELFAYRFAWYWNLLKKEGIVCDE